MMTDREISRLFSTPPFVGAVLRYSSFLEYDVDCLLALYFARPDRVEQALDLLVPELPLGRKLEVLRRLPLRHTKAHGDVLKSLKAFQRVRNLAAHSWTVSRAKVSDLLQDAEIRRLFEDYPSSLDASFRLTRSRLTRLRQSKAFGPDAKTGSFALDVRMIEKVLSDDAA